MNANQYTDPLGRLGQTLSGLYDFIPALRAQRTRGILEPPTAAPAPVEGERWSEGGGHGNDTSGWGEIGTPSPQELGLARDPNFGMLDAAQIMAAGLFGMPAVSMLGTIAQKQSGFRPENLFDPEMQAFPAPVSQVSVPMGTFGTTAFDSNWNAAKAAALANDLGLSFGGDAGQGLGLGDAFGGAGLGAIGGFEGPSSIGDIGGVGSIV